MAEKPRPGEVKDWRLPVTIVGVGGLGSPTALALARQGFPLTLYDFDRVEHKNIQNQQYTRTDEGVRKVVAMEHKIVEIDGQRPRVRRQRVTPRTRFHTPIVVAAVDSLPARKAILTACRRSPEVRLLVDGRLGMEGVKVLALNPHKRKEVAEYLPTLEGAAGPPCAQRFETHYALIGAGLLVRAINKALTNGGVERVVLLDGHTFHIMKDGPHPWRRR